jgi:hypothetical protein
MRLMTALTILAAGGAAFLGPLAPLAAGTERNGVLESGEAGFRHWSDPSLVFDLAAADADFSDDIFPGSGIPVAGNTGGIRNADIRWWRAYTGRGFTGAALCVTPNSSWAPPPGLRRNILAAHPASTC